MAKRRFFINKGASPLLIIMVVFIAFLTLDIFDKDHYYRIEAKSVISEKNIYSVINMGELYERTIESAVVFSAKKALYEIGNAGFDWGSEQPTDEELKERLKQMIMKEVKTPVGEAENFTIEKGNLDLEVSIASHGIYVYGSLPFTIKYMKKDFTATADFPGNFNRSVVSEYFNLARLVRKNSDCESIVAGQRRVDENGAETIDSRYLVSVKKMEGPAYEVSVEDTLDPNPFGEGNLKISVIVECS